MSACTPVSDMDMDTQSTMLFQTTFAPPGRHIHKFRRLHAQSCPKQPKSSSKRRQAHQSPSSGGTTKTTMPNSSSPWCKANGVTYYAQIHSPLKWTTSNPNPSINLADWDAAAEMVFPPQFRLEEMAEREYYENVIVPDERTFLLDEARRHLVVVAAGSVEGSRVEVIKDGDLVLGKGKGGGDGGELSVRVERG
ncbi:hypothetical protein BTJ68_08416 [Hortaea werneckii EXF-2000]|uniref:Uncharacterized protein n=1 Tax=Hortaea werneckii EXF-2000 TaxID=1157616 RepID=A0A1Z5T772_HORWE|nr:hypothetical protein BTJ68_08416 [Hortaea werneckii EXF-2000]